jgi:hypothetical protein
MCSKSVWLTVVLAVCSCQPSSTNRNHFEAMTCYSSTGAVLLECCDTNSNTYMQGPHSVCGHTRINNAICVIRPATECPVNLKAQE